MSGFGVEFWQELYNHKYLNNLRLNERQLDAILFYNARGEISTTEYTKKYKVTDRTARRDLTELVEKGILKKEGANKFSKYLFG